MGSCRLAVLWFGFMVRWQGLGPCRLVVVGGLLICEIFLFLFFIFYFLYFFRNGFGVVLVVVVGGLWV